LTLIFIITEDTDHHLFSGIGYVCTRIAVPQGQGNSKNIVLCLLLVKFLVTTPNQFFDILEIALTSSLRIWMNNNIVRRILSWIFLTGNRSR
jgi:hypothetical protein